MKMLFYIITILVMLLSCSSEKDMAEYNQGDLRVDIEQGQHWLHDFKWILGITIKNKPQIAVWTEDLQGNYLSSVYVTRKIATEGWIGDNRRKEALPRWCHQRGVIYEDGLYLPTKKRPLADGFTGATPKGSFDVKLTPQSGINDFVVFVEINHSTDFNESYPEDAQEGEENYTGGNQGSGQPALVYKAVISCDSLKLKSVEAQLIGHSSPDGSNGLIYEDLRGITSASSIVDHIRISIKQ